MTVKLLIHWFLLRISLPEILSLICISGNRMENPLCSHTPFRVRHLIMSSEGLRFRCRRPRHEWFLTVGCLIVTALFTGSSCSDAFVLFPYTLARQTATTCCVTNGEEQVDKISGDQYPDEEEEIHPSAAWLRDLPVNPTPSLHDRKFSRRTLAVDYGTHAVGLATGIGFAARMLPGIINRGNDTDVARRVLIRARGEGARDIVVGLPLFRNGTESDTCKLVRKFSYILADVGAASPTPVSVVLWDERFTTAQAQAMIDRYGGNMGKRVEVDSLAASLVLDHYFATGGEGAERVEPQQAGPELLAAAGIRDEQEKEAMEDLATDFYAERREWLRDEAE